MLGLWALRWRLGGAFSGRFWEVGGVVVVRWLDVCERGFKMQRWKALRGGVVGAAGAGGGLLVRELRRSFGCSAIGPHESKRARYYEGKGGECEGPSSSEVHGVHVFQCRVSRLFSFSNLRSHVSVEFVNTPFEYSLKN